MRSTPTSTCSKSGKRFGTSNCGLRRNAKKAEKKKKEVNMKKQEPRKLLRPAPKKLTIAQQLRRWRQLDAQYRSQGLAFPRYRERDKLSRDLISRMWNQLNALKNQLSKFTT